MYKNFLYCFAICIWVFAAIGGTAYLFFYGKPQFGIAAIAVAAMAVPFVIKCWKKITGSDE